MKETKLSVYLMFAACGEGQPVDVFRGSQTVIEQTNENGSER